MSETGAMSKRFAFVGVLALSLGGCSYDYEVDAVDDGGALAFIIPAQSPNQPSCVRQIAVVAENDGARIAIPSVEDTSRHDDATVWRVSVNHDDDCANSFPLRYGVHLKGDPVEGARTVSAKPLLRNIIYEVSATTGSTGYGRGRFIIHGDGQIENLRRRDLAGDALAPVP